MKKLSIPLPDETFDWLQGEAERNHRTVSGQVRFFLDLERQTKPDETSQTSTDQEATDQ